jgi:hypothetical protein
MDPVRARTPVRSRGNRIRSIAPLAGAMLLTLSLGAGTTLADGHRGHGDADNTFTKWITAFPAMTGVVGGDVGAGSYTGEILRYSPGTTAVIEALYHFDGSKHVFSALVHVEQTGLKAVISGVVTEGWLKGHQIEGKYTQITCTQAPDGNCFEGSLDILRRFGD